MALISWAAERACALLHAVGLAPSVPEPYADRLAKLDPATSSLDNEIYDSHTFDWSRSGLALLNPVRVNYFLDKLHRLVSALDPVQSHTITILDLGCGSGIAVEAIYDAIAHSHTRVTADGIVDGNITYKLLGIDMSSRSIELGRQRAASRGMSIEYVVGDIYALPFSSASIDAIICSDVLEHLFDLRSAFSHIARVLKPNGVFSFDTINRTPTSFYLTIWILQEILRAMQGDAHDHRLYLTPQEAHTLMRDSKLIQGPQTDLVGMRPRIQLPPVAIYKLLTGAGFISSCLTTFTQTSDLSISYLHWCSKPPPP